jgi:hypothetical protein
MSRIKLVSHQTKDNKHVGTYLFSIILFFTSPALIRNNNKKIYTYSQEKEKKLHWIWVKSSCWQSTIIVRAFGKNKMTKLPSNHLFYFFVEKKIYAKLVYIWLHCFA